MVRSLAVSLLLVSAIASSASADGHAAATGPAPTPEPTSSDESTTTTTTASSAMGSTSSSPAKKPAKVEVPTTVAVLIAYQRVGHDLLALQEQRGVFDCGDLMPRFRAIKLDAALATPASRTAAATTLTDLAAQIERYRGIHVEQACLDNPLAAGCQ